DAGGPRSLRRLHFDPCAKSVGRRARLAARIDESWIYRGHIGVFGPSERAHLERARGVRCQRAALLTKGSATIKPQVSGVRVPEIDLCLLEQGRDRPYEADEFLLVGLR